MDEKRYIDLVKNQIELDKLLASTNPKYHKELRRLLELKQNIMQKNGFFADYQLRKIYKKIMHIKNKS